jgi:ribosomal protein L37AE/L43A
MKSPLVPLQERLTEKFHALLGKCDLVANTAAPGETFDNLETFFIDEGRNFIQHVFQEKRQERIGHAEDNASPICPDCQKKTTIQDNKSKDIIAAYGPMKRWRDYHQCPACKSRTFPVEITLGIPKRYSNGVKERIAYIIGLSSYRLVDRTLKLFLGIHLSPSTIGKIADETADEMDARLQKNPDVRKDFQQAKGETEFQIDGTCMNTRNDKGEQEYREMKTAVAARRECGERADPSEWDVRDLPEPNAVYAVAAIDGIAFLQGMF